MSATAPPARFEPACVPRLGAESVPRVWALLSERAGDDVQILALVRALGWPFEAKRLVHRRGGRLLDVFRGSNRLGIRVARSTALSPPWPDLVISASMRNEPVCRWIRSRSHGQTRYVHIGKPWARLSSFDLVISTPEYRWIPDRENVLRNTCSLHEVTPERLRREADDWASTVSALPRPLVAVLVGGYAGPYPFDRANAARLGREASDRARRLGGSLLVTTSKRTSRAASEALRDSIDVPCSYFEWRPGSEPNPYYGYLGLADELIVTCDSTSMLAEACATQKPVRIFDLSPDRDREGGGIPRWFDRCNRERLMALLYRNGLLRLAPNKLKRDIRCVHERLIEAGRAVWIGDDFPDSVPPPLDEMPRSVERVRRLFGTSSAPV